LFAIIWTIHPVTAVKQYDTRTAPRPQLSRASQPNMTQLGFQTTRRLLGQGNLSTSKFLGIYATIWGHDVFAIPINKTAGIPSFNQAFNLQTFANLSFLPPSPAHLQNQWRAVATGVALARVRGNDRQLPL
jgi:hypothetical protein